MTRLMLALVAGGFALTPAVAADRSSRPVRVAPITHRLHPRGANPEDLDALACPTVARCVAVGGNGFEVAFDPRRPPPEYSSRIDRFHSVFAVACPSAVRCTASANPGRELSFDPVHAGPWAGPGGSSRELLPGTDASTVACVSVRVCVIASGGTVVGFDPRTRAVLTRRTLPLGGNISRIACPASRLCVAVDYSGDEATFNPRRSRSTRSRTGLDPAAGFASVSCPTATQCTAIDDAAGPEITFDPETDAVLSNANLDPHTATGATDISCPSSRQCTLIDGDHLAVTFDPVAPTRRRFLHTGIDGGAPAIACPSTAQCTALGDTLERTFDPRTAGTPAQ